MQSISPVASGPVVGGLSWVDVLTLIVLASTLFVTARLARSTGIQAQGTMGQLALMNAVNARALVSVRSIRASWKDNHLETVNFEIGNSGLGAAFNVVVILRGCGRDWSVSPPDQGAGRVAYGAICTGESRAFVAQAASRGDNEGWFNNQLSIEIEAFDVLRDHFVYIHSFRLAPGVEYAEEVGLSVEGPTSKGS